MTTVKIVIDMASPTDSNIRKEDKKIEKEELEQMWKVKSKAVPVVTGT